jgi:hypothetical protein
MAYHGYIPSLKAFLSSLPESYVPAVLEVGVDRGVTFISLLTHLARTRDRFVMFGVDIKVQEALLLTLGNIDRTQEQVLQLSQQNSLEALPQLVKMGAKFDVLLIDGDHNYYTVKQELDHVPALTYDHSVIIIDDYHGRWAEKDLWYATREEHATDLATQPVDTDKHGVAAAVDEWLENNPDWSIEVPLKGEPVVLRRKHNSYGHEQDKSK